jgi:hypothetical protein
MVLAVVGRPGGQISRSACVRRADLRGLARVLARPTSAKPEWGPRNAIDVPAAVRVYTFSAAMLAGGAGKSGSITPLKDVLPYGYM